MFGDLMGKLQDMKQQMDEAKSRLADMTVQGEAEGGKIKVTVSGNHRIREIEISEELAADHEALQELLIVAINKAMEKADEIHETEMQGVAKFNIPGLDL